MAPAEVLGNQAMSGEEALRMPRRLKPLHAPLPLACRLMRILRTVVEVVVPAMFQTGQDFALGGTIARHFCR